MPVRCNGSSMGFVADIRRMNVAITRAKSGLYIMGHTATLEHSPDWRALIAEVCPFP